MYENTFPSKRFKHTIEFLEKHVNKDATILDLGVSNPFSEIMKERGFNVTNTKGEDLDLDFSTIVNSNTDVVTAFEIFEHLVAPFNALTQIKANKLVASVPLRLWFAPAYKSATDAWDRHYHEFEDWQFDWLLKKSGWKIIRKEKWRNPSIIPGFRPILRNFYKRYYAIEAEKIN